MLRPTDLVDRAGTLATVPSVYLRLTEAAEDPRGSLDEVARIIEEDTALTARLLRVVNSAAYGFGGPVEDVGRAVRLIGLTEVIELALATAVVRNFGGIPPSRVNMREFWLHGVACGVAARTIARLARRSRERLFTGGVLHDVGRLLLYLLEPERMWQAQVEADMRRLLLHEAEREVFGFDHADVGEALLAAWGLPPALRAAAGHHHGPLAASTHGEDAAVIHVADVLVHALELGSSGERLVPPVAPAVWEMVGLGPSDLEPLLEDIQRQYADVVQVLLLYEGRGPSPA